MRILKKVFLSILIIVNCMVLMGQVWPSWAPPIARQVNIAFLCVNLIFLTIHWLLVAKEKKEKPNSFDE